MTYHLGVFHVPDEVAFPAHQQVHVKPEVIVVRTLALLLAQLATAPIVSETVETGERRLVDLGTFECRDITRSTVLQRVCYDRAQQNLVVANNGAYDRYCGVTPDTVESLLGAPSMGQFFNQNIKPEATTGSYACRTHEPAQKD
ncbi:KTSC domain-containing protein [Bradyrhizobium sp. Rc2d]|nr:KTSC domain-containing protein [Bradyrhizobium sp. Rc2d]